MGYKSLNLMKLDMIGFITKHSRSVFINWEFPKKSGAFCTGGSILSRRKNQEEGRSFIFFIFSRSVFRSIPRISAALVLLLSTLAKTLRMCSTSTSARVR